MQVFGGAADVGWEREMVDEMPRNGCFPIFYEPAPPLLFLSLESP